MRIKAFYTTLLIALIYSGFDIFILSSAFDPVILLIMGAMLLLLHRKAQNRIIFILAFLYLLFALAVATVFGFEQADILIDKASTWSFMYFVLGTLGILKYKNEN